MLQALREKLSGWVAMVIVGILAVPFAFFGMEQYLFQNASGEAATVQAPPSWWPSAPDWALVRKLAWDSEPITLEAFRRAFDNERMRRREQQGERFDARAFETPDAKREVLDTLIDQAVMRLAARRAGIAIGEGQVNSAIQSVSAFQVEGRFDPQRYQLMLQSQSPPLTPAMYREIVREELQQALVPTQIARSAFVTDNEIERALALLDEKREVSFAVIPAPPPDTAAISGEEIQNWYASHTHLYRAPETLTLELIDIDASQLPPLAEPDEAALQQRYEQEKARFSTPEQRLASHLLIRPAGDDEAAHNAAEARAAALAEQARGGVDFATLARENSDDTGSKASGGDLGWVERGMMVAPFEAALFALQAGEISAPVRTEFGWHVLHLRDIRLGTQIAFEQIREQLAEEERDAARERQFSDLSGQIVDAVYRNPTSLEPAAELLGKPVQTLGPFARGEGTGLAARPEIQRAAFSESLIQDGTVSDPITLGPQHVALIRVSAHTPERALSVEEARQQIVVDIRTDRTARQARTHADALFAQLTDGATLDAVAKEAGVAVSNIPVPVPRGVGMPHPAAAAAYFQLPAPAEGAPPTPGKVLLPDNSAVLFTVNAVEPGSLDAVPPDQLPMVRQQFSALYGDDDATTFVQLLRRQMKVSVDEAQL